MVGVEGEGDAVAGYSARGDYDIAGGGVARHLDGNRGVRPGNHIRRCAADGHAAVALGRAEVGSGNFDQSRRGSVVGADAADLAERVTVKLLELFTVLPLAWTLTGPLVAPAGTLTWMLVLDWLRMVAGMPLKVTAPLPPPSIRPVPVMVTGVPAGPLAGETSDGGIRIEGEGGAVAGSSVSSDDDIAGGGVARHLDGDHSIRPRNDIGRRSANGHAAGALSRAEVGPGNFDRVPPELRNSG